jgi:HD-like signal output (HDOD) protein
MSDDSQLPSATTGPLPSDATRKAIESEMDRWASLLPPMPAILGRLEQEMSSEWMNISRLGNLIRSDPALGTAVLKVANSPLMRGSRAISEVEEAIQRIGKDNLRSLATVVSLRKNNLPKAGLLGAPMDEFWRHSLLVAAGAVQIARSRTTDREILEQVWTAGLLHDLGALLAPLLYAEEFENVVDRIGVLKESGERQILTEIEQDAFGFDHARIGEVFAERGWKLSASVSALVGGWTDPTRIEPPYAAWAVRRADEAAQILGVCWQPECTRLEAMEILPKEWGAGTASDPDMCRTSVERHLDLVNALMG